MTQAKTERIKAEDVKAAKEKLFKKALENVIRDAQVFDAVMKIYQQNTKMAGPLAIAVAEFQ